MSLIYDITIFYIFFTADKTPQQKIQSHKTGMNASQVMAQRKISSEKSGLKIICAILFNSYEMYHIIIVTQEIFSDVLIAKKTQKNVAQPTKTNQKTAVKCNAAISQMTRHGQRKSDVQRQDNSVSHVSAKPKKKGVINVF